MKKFNKVVRIIRDWPKITEGLSIKLNSLIFTQT